MNENSEHEHSVYEEETNMSKEEIFSINQTNESDLETGAAEIVGQIKTKPTVQLKATNKEKKYNQHSCEFKLKAIEDAKKNTNQSVANKLGIPKGTLRQWKATEDRLREQLEKGGGKRSYFNKIGARVHNKELEAELVDWVMSHGKGELTYNEIRQQALNINSRSCGEDSANAERRQFRASQGWLWGFLSRNNSTKSPLISLFERILPMRKEDNLEPVK